MVVPDLLLEPSPISEPLSVILYRFYLLCCHERIEDQKGADQQPPL